MHPRLLGPDIPVCQNGGVVACKLEEDPLAADKDTQALRLSSSHDVFSSNTAGNFGGGLYLKGSALLRFFAALIANNAADWGGGLYCDLPEVFLVSLLEQVIFEGNSASTAMVCHPPAALIIKSQHLT